MYCTQKEISSSIDHIIYSCELLIKQAEELKNTDMDSSSDDCDIYLAIHNMLDHSSRAAMEIGELVLLLN